MYFLSKVNKETIWGSEELVAYGADPARKRVGSLYTLAANEDLTCHIIGGEMDGRSLYEVFTENPAAFGYKPGDSFPIIASFIGAKDDLSIQIHPDDAYAKRVEGKPFGKSEAWIFLRAPKNGQLAIGCNAKTRDELMQMAEEGRWQEIVGTMQVEEGDYVYVSPGTLHALTVGTIVYELQQATDITYRFYDYDRVDDAGNKRELHVEKTLDVIDVHKKPEKQRFWGTAHEEPGFCLEGITLGGTFTNQSRLFCCITVIKGETKAGTRAMKQGDSLLLLPGESVEFSQEVTAILARPREMDAQ